jgi:hypothetical protein
MTIIFFVFFRYHVKNIISKNLCANIEYLDEHVALLFLDLLSFQLCFYVFFIMIHMDL